MPDKIDVDTMIERLSAPWRNKTEHEGAATLSALKAERDDWHRVADRRAAELVRCQEAETSLRADLERAREALRAAGNRVSAFLNIITDGPDDSDVAMAVRKLREARDIIAAALSPSSAPVETPNDDVMASLDAALAATDPPSPESYEPSEAEIEAVLTALSKRSRWYIDRSSDEVEGHIGDALIAAHNARSAKT